MKRGKKIVFFINHAAFFVSHRLPLALHAKKNGYEVFLLTGLPASKTMEIEALKIINKYKINYSRVLISPSGYNFLIDLIGIFQTLIYFIIKRPSIIHTASTKPILYGGLIAKFLRIKGLVVSFAGLGYIFTGQRNFFKKILGAVFIIIQRIILAYPNSRVIVQNKDDQNFLINHQLINKERISLIRGSGVDLKKFKYNNSLNSRRIVLFPSRLLKNKGVTEFLEAAKILTSKYPEWQFHLVGSADYDHPTTIPLKELNKYLKIKNIKWHGYKSNMYPFFKNCSIVCLPSYREGMPKSLLEAAATGKAVVTTNAIGCRDSIVRNKTGYLVPARNIHKLVRSLEILMTDNKIRSKFGKRGRQFAEKTFDLKIVQNKVLKLYEKTLIK